MHPTSHRTPLLRRLVALVAASALIVTACGNSGDEETSTDTTTTTAGEGTPTGDEAASGDVELGEFQPIEGVPGVTDDEIAFAVLGTGPSNPLGYCLLECYRAGVEAYFEHRNELGGVHGRDLVVSRVEDDELANTQIKLLELVEADVFGILAAPLQYAGYEDVGRTDVPLYTTFPASPEVEGIQNIYVPGGTICLDCPTPSTVQAASFVGATKVGSIGFGVSQASKDCVARARSEVEMFGAEAGVEFAYFNDELAFGFPNGVGPEVTAMKDAGVDFITTCIDQTSVITLEQELHRQGMDDVTVVLPQGYGDDEYLSANADLLEGDMLALAYMPAEAELPEGSEAAAMVEALGELGQLNDYAIQGWMGAHLAVTGLLAAGPQFDQAGVVAATNQITDYDGGGLLQPVDWTTAHDVDPEASNRWCSAYLVVRDGSLELQGDPAKPMHCWDLPLDAWAEPETVGSPAGS